MAGQENTMDRLRPTSNSKIFKQYRCLLPVPVFPKNESGIWSVLKHCIGKDLSKITMPVVFNEPLSFLQRLTEYMEYSFLLQKANECDDPLDRIQYVAAFAVSALASNWERLGKPFNPLLGETYELVRHNETYTWTNVTCCVHNIIVGKLWFEQYGTLELTGHDTGLIVVLNFKQAGWFCKDLHRIEGFIYDKQKTKLRFLYGKWTEYLKSAEIEAYEDYICTHPKNVCPPDRAQPLSGQNTSMFSNTPTSSPVHTPKKIAEKFHSFTRCFSSSAGKAASAEYSSILSTPVRDDVNGIIPKCDSSLSLDILNSVILWQADPRPENSAKYYYFTLFAMALNELDDDLRHQLPPTDSRLRPDIHKLELRDIDGAAYDKNRLEEKQRESKKQRKRERKIWEPNDGYEASVTFLPDLVSCQCVIRNVRFLRVDIWRKTCNI
ncbi:oxysterol-binding protein-related protein 1-like isoform X6 [Tachypleus tridentatus]|uniref:oxysterol-binding protein-related protein 1-like isoform X6 n=1 Tax=Tachypleus tridentatus TaxID=6853 RepID=UPI003FD128D3